MSFLFVITKIIQIRATVALLLCNVGATIANKTTEISTQASFRAGITLFLVIYALLLILTIGATTGQKCTQRGETTLLCALVMALPLLLVRIVYLVILSFRPNTSFTNSITAELLMAITEEMVIVLVYMWAGLLTSCVPKNIKEKKSDVQNWHIVLDRVVFRVVSWA